ncbi:transcriptional regulator, LacI family [Thermoanaerobacter italicus Ab9]|uniref:Transcriptional regulator, LacI family n=1 Tax=Thermoanaerobacter italicus (strain DSM 9252 / Ab9) TaxID=580331 RepID=D3T5G2_THEIA|nr:LacI family DNA-binding transcriptional regulator [Thermoanaerobacter italicus]ADD03335.1 transcriptional regulator, LacI family [Thermoanaerobacter italicus Ab9]
MAANIKDVARKANVSTATVSHVINNTRYVSEEVKSRVIQAMKELNYRPNSVARSLRSKKSNTIGLIVPVRVEDTSSFFFMSVAQGIESALKKHGYNLLLSNSNENIEYEKEQIRIFNSLLIDGLIITPTAEEHSYLNEILTTSYPVVFIDRRPRGVEGDCVLSDGYTGTYEAICYMIQKGYKRIGYISGPMGLTTSDERFEGYKRAILDNGFEIELSLIKEAEATYKNGYELAKELVNEQKVTAIFAANNVMTIGALEFLQEQNLKIPEDVAIIGFDDYEWTKIISPPLTVVKQYPYDLGIKAAEVLLDRIKNPKKKYKEYRLPTKLVIRHSC